MRRLVPVLWVAAAACGGAQVPVHNGYKTDKPWKKVKAVKLDDKGEGKDDGDLSYPDRRRAKWLVVETPSYGSLDVKLDITPPGDNASDDFDMGLEVLDAGYRSLVLADADNGDDAHELSKKRTLADLAPGKYYVHLFLEGRMDAADYSLHVSFKSTVEGDKSDFPAQVASLAPLPTVPIADDAPPDYKPPVPPPQQKPPHGPHTPPGTGGGHQPPPPPPPPKDKDKDKDKDKTPTSTARVVGVSVVGDQTKILIAANGSGTMHGTLKGVGTFEVSCNGQGTCVGLVKAPPDVVNKAGDVILTP